MPVPCCGGHHRTTVATVRSIGAAGHQIDLAVAVSPGKFRWQRWLAAWVSQWKGDLSPHAAIVSCEWPMFERLHGKLLLHRTLAADGLQLPAF